jgi:hypothetical protein
MALEGENNEILLLRIHVSIVVDSDCLSLYYKKLVCLYCEHMLSKKGLQMVESKQFLTTNIDLIITMLH